MAQLTHFFALLLWVAAGMALVAGMAQLAAAIAVVVLVNGVFAFVQERGAEHAAERLADLLPRRARVRRDGRTVEVDAGELVPGDVRRLLRARQHLDQHRPRQYREHRGAQGPAGHAVRRRRGRRPGALRHHPAGQPHVQWSDLGGRHNPGCDEHRRISGDAILHAHRR